MSTDHEPACDWRDTAWAFALGSSSPEEDAAFHEHLFEGCADCGAELASARATLADLDTAVARRTHGQAPAAPSADLAQRLRASLPGRQRGPTPFAELFDEHGAGPSGLVPSSVEGVATHHGSDPNQAWRDTEVEGVHFKLLAHDAERRFATALVRMEPGSAYPPHEHAGREECFVLSGDLSFGDDTLAAGDYQVAEEGSVHPVQSTEGGCLLLIVSSLDDRPLAG